jgi:hypothetical protein
LPTDVPVVDEYYVTKDVWSRESLARRDALLASIRDQGG